MHAAYRGVAVGHKERGSRADAAHDVGPMRSRCDGMRANVPGKWARSEFAIDFRPTTARMHRMSDYLLRRRLRSLLCDRRFAMIHQTSLITSRGRWVSAFVVFGAALASSSRVEASCGDYVALGGHHASGHGPMRVERHGTGGSGAPACQGVMCDRRVPPLAPAPKAVVVAEQWAMLANFSAGSPPFLRRWRADIRVAPSAGFNWGILRPPRF